MSILTPGTPASNARQVRALAQALTSLHKPSTIPAFTEVFKHSETSKALATLATEDASVLFPSLQSALSIPHPYARTASLQATILTAQYAPPSVLSDHWTSLAQRVISLLKSVIGANPGLTAKALASLSTLIIAGAPLALKGGEHKTAVTTVCHSAVSHATRILDDENPAAAVSLAAIALLFSVLHAAPRELRQGLPRLEAVLWGKWIDHPMPRLRNAAAKLLAHLLACHANKVKQNVFAERIQGACQQLDQILDILDLFAPGEEIRKAHPKTLRKSSSLVGTLSFSADQLSIRYSAVSELLRHLLQQTCPVSLELPLPILLHTLCRGVSERQIDPYATGCEGVVLNADGAVTVAATTDRESLLTLIVLIDTAHQGAVLPYVHVVARTFRRRLSQIILHVRTRDGAIACIQERQAMYVALSRLVTVLGFGFMEQIVQLFSELFEGDVDLYSHVMETEAMLLQHSTTLKPDSTRSRKRRRNSHMSNLKRAQKDGSAGPETGHQPAKGLGTRTVQDVNDVLTAGVEVAIAMFENRGLPSPPTIIALQKLEVAVAHLTRYRSDSPDLFESIRAVALGGGSSRMQGEASPLLFRCLLLSKDAELLANSSFEVRRVAFRARSSCESICHPRGPPILRALFCKQETNHKKADGVAGGSLVAKSGAPNGVDDPENQQMDVEQVGNRTGQTAQLANMENNLQSHEGTLSSESPHQQQRASDSNLDVNQQKENSPVENDIEIETAELEDSALEKSQSLARKLAEGQNANFRTEIDQHLVPSSMTDADTMGEGKKASDSEPVSLPTASNEAIENDVNAVKKQKLTATAIEDPQHPVSEVNRVTALKSEAGRDTEEHVSDEDEEALIASLNFEPPDQE